MPRMTPELIMLHPTYLSPVKDRELDLRGNKIPAIENLGVTKVCSSAASYGAGFRKFEVDRTLSTRSI